MQLIDRGDLAALLKVDAATLDRWRSSGRVPPPIKLGRAVRWRADDIDDWIAAGCPPVDRWTAMKEGGER